MSDTASNVVAYTPLESGDGESRWIRLEQVKATLPGPSLADAAGLMDALFGIEPCDDGLGGGGEEAGKDPDEEKVEEELSILLEKNGQCRQGWWLAALNVYRTHRTPEYELRSETARVETVEEVEESYRQVVDVAGAMIELERPYGGELSGIPAGVKWTVRGATVNLDRPVRERLILRYRTWHEHVTLRVPTKKTDDGEEYEPAAVVAFWGDLAAECELEPPEPEDEEDMSAKKRVCNRKRPPDEPTDCWKTVRHFKRCQCSYKETDEWEEQVPAPCDGAPSGAHVGHEEKFDGFTWCEGEEDDELSDPDYYETHCCKRPHTALPNCRRQWNYNNGGKRIEGGPDHWRNIYGDDVVMIGVMPEQGHCGEKVTIWNVPSKNCCDDVIPLSPDPSNPEVIAPGGTYLITVRDGKPGELLWRATGGLVFVQNESTELRTAHRAVYVKAENGVCPEPTITVDDGCSPLEMTFEGAETDPPTLYPTDMTVSPGAQFQVFASGGVPPYMWTAGSGLRMIGWTDNSAVFEAGPVDTWCVADIDVTDACGKTSEPATVRNAQTGRWRQLPASEFDPCAPPGAPFEMVNPANTNGQTKPNGGYYAYVSSATTCSSSCGCVPVTQNICPEGVFVAGEEGHRNWCLTGSGHYNADWSGGCCTWTNVRGDITYQRSFSSRATTLFKWVCNV